MCTDNNKALIVFLNKALNLVEKQYSINWKQNTLCFVANSEGIFGDENKDVDTFESMSLELELKTPTKWSETIKLSDLTLEGYVELSDRSV